MWLEKVWYVNNNRHIYIRDRLDKTNAQYQRNTWFYDMETKTIRNAHKDWKDKYAFDIRGAAYMHPIDSRWYQMFDLKDGYIEVEQQQNQVLTVQHHQDINDRHIVREARVKTVELWQTWDIVYTDNVPEGYNDGEFNAKWGFYVGKPFHIVSMFGEHRMADVYDNTNVAIKTRNGRPSQLWYFDGVTKTIKSKHRAGVSLDMRSNWAQVHGTGQQWHQLFRYNTSTQVFYNQNKRVMDIHQQKDIEGQRVWFENPVANRIQQTWQIVYEDTMVKENETGMTRFGFRAGKPFFVQSRMWLEKVWYCHDNAHLYIRDRLDKSNKMYQRNTWYYDHRSKTIRNTDYNNQTQAVDARSAHIRMNTLDSRWY